MIVRRSPVEQLRRAVEALPEDTRVAMLTGIRRHEIIAGAFADRVGGVCPMLAAHRCGSRTSANAFARAWDRFTGATVPLVANDEQLMVLESLLEASLLETLTPERVAVPV